MTAIAERILRMIPDRYPSRIGGEPALTDRLDPVVYGGPGDGPLTREDGSSSNISPWPRTNLFAVYNSIENAIGEPYADVPPRPQVIANRQDFSPVVPS